MACSGDGLLTIRTVFLILFLSGHVVLSLRKDDETEYLNRENASQFTGAPCKPWSHPPCVNCWTRWGESMCKSSVKAAAVVPTVVNYLKPCTPYTTPPCHKCWTKAGAAICAAGKVAIDNACVPWSDPPCNDCITGPLGEAACKAQKCFPWHNPPCTECATSVGESACKTTVKQWDDKVMKFYNDNVVPFKAEARYFDHNYTKYTNEEREQWIQNAVCKIGIHTGVFVIGKVGCYVAMTSVGAYICVALGFATGVETAGVGAVIATPICAGMVGFTLNLVCGGMAAKFQEKAIYDYSGATKACDAMGYTNPLPMELRSALLED